MYPSNSASCLHCSSYQPFIIYWDHEQLQCVHFQVRSDVNVHFTECLSKRKVEFNPAGRVCARAQKKCNGMHACTKTTKLH